MAILNNDQSRVYYKALDWFKKRNEQTFEISGPPGSGKTFLINYIIDSLGINRDRIAPMSYTGAAAINMRVKGMYNARTCYSWLYNCVQQNILDEKGNPIMDPIFNRPKTKIQFIKKHYLDNIDLILVDEAGSVPPDIRKVIDEKGLPVIAAGDLDQLPPIEGKPGYLNNPSKVHIINEIMRQNANNSIIVLSQRAKHNQPIHNGFYGNVLVIYEDELTDDMIRNSSILICGKNNTRDYYTNYIRHKLLGYHSNLPMHGERVVCRKNNWTIESNGINLTNGLLGNVINYPDPSCIDRKRYTYIMNFKPDLGDLPFNNLECDFKYLISNYNIRNQLKNSPYSFGNKFEFGYAITTHMSQGSEFNNGIYIEEYLNPSINNKLNYVGLTRFKNFCIYVKRRPKKYY
jgi:exodeoxyribonuclease-5